VLATSLSLSPQIRSSTFYQNVATGLGGGVAVTGNVNTGTVRNTVFYGNSSDMTGEGLVSIAYTCSEDFLSIDATNMLAFSDPVVLGPNDELFLDQGSDCVDMGDDAAATADYGAIGSNWQQMTTSIDATLDVTPVDAGVHYPP